MIKQLTEGVRPVILGLIKIGDKGGKGGSPRKFEGFKIFKPDKDGQGQPVLNEKLQKEMEEKYGSPLKELPVFFLSNTLDSVFDAQYSWYAKIEGVAQRMCYGDGEKGHRLQYDRETQDGHAQLLRDPTGELLPRKDLDCPCNLFTYDPEVSPKEAPCKWSCKLAFMLADYPKLGGYYIFRTHGVNSIRALFFSLAQLETLTLKNLSGIPVTLVHSMVRNKRNQPIPVVRLEAALDPSAVRLKAIEQVRENVTLVKEIEAADEYARKLLTTVEPDEEEEVQEEFYPTEGDGPSDGEEPQGDLETELQSMVETEPVSARTVVEAGDESEGESPEEDLPDPPPQATDSPAKTGGKEGGAAKKKSSAGKKTGKKKSTKGSGKKAGPKKSTKGSGKATKKKAKAKGKGTEDPPPPAEGEEGQEGSAKDKKFDGFLF
jgi:hypothetical protein